MILERLTRGVDLVAGGRSASHAPLLQLAALQAGCPSRRGNFEWELYGAIRVNKGRRRGLEVSPRDVVACRSFIVVSQATTAYEVPAHSALQCDHCVVLRAGEIIDTGLERSGAALSASDRPVTVCADYHERANH